MPCNTDSKPPTGRLADGMLVSGAGRTIAASIVFALLLVACATAPSDWSELTPPATAPMTEAARPWQAELDRFEAANSATTLAQSIEGLSAFVEQGHSDPALLTTLAEAHVLYGAAWASSRREKREHYQQAIGWTQKALLANPAFARAIQAGQSPAEAAQTLPQAAVPAMVIWVTATAYQFEETMGPLQRLRQFRRMAVLKSFMERALELDPGYQYGVVPFSLAIYYIAAPGFAGGDLDRAERLLDQAIETPGVSLLPQWGRARYLHTLQANPQARRQDLEWVLAQDPRAADSAYRWNVYLQADARRLLAEME